MDLIQRLILVAFSFFMAVILFIALTLVLPDLPIEEPPPTDLQKEFREMPRPDFTCADTLLRAPGGLYGSRATVCYDGYIWEEHNTMRLTEQQYMKLIDPLRRQLLEDVHGRD